MKRPRLTVRRMMIAVAGLALLLWLFVLSEDKRRANFRDECRYNLGQIAMALIQYERTQGSFPAGTVPRVGAPPESRVSWTIHLASFLDSNIHSIGIAGNPTVIPPREFRLLQCPSNPSRVTSGGHGLIHFVGIAGLGTDSPTLPAGHPRAGVFGYDRRTRLADIRDGTATTMMLAETGTANGPWYLGGPATVRGVDSSRRPYIGPGRQFGGTHPEGANVAFADGSVRFVSDSVDPKVFEAISTIAGGEIVPASEWEGPRNSGRGR